MTPRTRLTLGPLALVPLAALAAFAQSPEQPAIQPAIQPPATRPSGIQPATRPVTTARSVEDMFDNLLPDADRPAPAPLRPVPKPNAPPTYDATGGPNAVAPGAPQTPLVREGTLLVDRLGRLTKTDGRDEFAFQADGATLGDPPMVLLPNATLALMEDAAAAAGQEVLFRVTGTVTEFRGRNYLLLDKAVQTAR